MLERKHIAGVVLCSLLAGAANADSIRLVSRIGGPPSATADDFSWTHTALEPLLWSTPPTGSQISADGRYLAFISRARNLIAGLGDTNPFPEIYLHDRVTGTTVLVSHSAASPTTAANGQSWGPMISADGRHVAFSSQATDLVAGQSDTNNAADVFLFDRVTGTVSLVSHAAGSATTAGDHGSGSPFLSADGRRIAFASDADDLIVAQAASSSQQVFVFDVEHGMALVSHVVGAPTQPANGASSGPSLSANGELLAYTSEATDLVSGVTDTNGASDVFLYNWNSSQSVLVSRTGATPTAAASGASAAPTVSADGTHVAFVSKASNLVVGQSGQVDGNVFLYRRADAAMTLVSHSLAGAQQAGNQASVQPVLNQDGSYIAFVSAAEDLVDSFPTLHSSFVFLFQSSNGSLTRLSQAFPAEQQVSTSGNDPRISADGNLVAFTQAVTSPGGGVPLTEHHVDLYDRGSGLRTRISGTGGDSRAPELSADGQVAAFASFSTDLVAHDFNNTTDVFVYSRMAGTRSLVSRAGVPAVTSPLDNLEPSLSEDGNFVAFLSAAPNLVPGQIDTNRQRDVFVWSGQTGVPGLVSRAAVAAPITAAAGSSSTPALSPDGDWVAFQTTADDLVPGQAGPSGLLKLVLVERATGRAILVSHVTGSPTVPTPGGLLASPVLSRDGRFVAFIGVYSHLLPGQTASSYQVFLYDRVADSTVLVSHRYGAPAMSSNTSSIDVDLSADGRFVVFATQATDLGAFDNNGALDVFLHDWVTGARTLLSRSTTSSTITANGGSVSPKISSDGRWIYFVSEAMNLIPGGPFGSNLYLYDRVTDTLTLASHAAGQPTTGIGGVGSFDLSADGRFAAFTGWGGNGHTQIFLYDRTTGEGTLVSHEAAAPGTASNGSVTRPWISADGRFVTFTSTATNLVAGVTDGSESSDVFLYERETGAMELVSRSDASPLVAKGGIARGISADGGQVLLHSEGSLIPEDRNGTVDDIYLYENVLPAQDFHSMTLCRALDTRQPVDGPALVSGTREYFTVPGACGVPVTAKAVLLNVTVVQPAGAGYLKLHAGNAGSPASSINFAAGQLRSNNTTVRLSTNGDGTIAITPFVAGGGTVHVILDVMGYFE